MEVEGYDIKKVKNEPGEEFELVRFYFNMANINNLVQGFLGLLDTVAMSLALLWMWLQT